MKQPTLKPKILFIAHTNNLKGGGELSVIELIKSAKQRGYEPYVVIPGEGDFAAAMSQMKIEYIISQYFYWGRPYSAAEAAANFTAIQSICKAITEHQINCVVTNTLMIPWGALAAAITDKPHIWITREKLNQHRKHLFENYDFIEKYSNLIFANSKDNTDYLKTEVGLKNVKQFYSYVDDRLIRLSHDYQQPRIINLSALIQPSKDQLGLVEALAELKKRGQLSLKTVFIGGYLKDDEYFKEVKALIDKNDLSNMVSFVGFHSEPFKLIGPNDIFVRSSKYESLGQIGRAHV